MASGFEEQDAVRKVDNSLLSAAIQLTLIADLMARSVASGSLEFISSNSPLSECPCPIGPRAGALPTPVVALNRAIAIAENEGPDAALTTIDAIASDLDTYHLLHAARGTMLRRIGRRDDARAAFERAVDVAAADTDRRFLAQQIAELT